MGSLLCVFVGFVFFSLALHSSVDGDGVFFSRHIHRHLWDIITQSPAGDGRPGNHTGHTYTHSISRLGTSHTYRREAGVLFGLEVFRPIFFIMANECSALPRAAYFLSLVFWRGASHRKIRLLKY